MQRFCLTLAMYPDAALIAEYKDRHRHVWPEVLQSLRDAGVVGMQIFLHEHRLIMVMETTDEFTFARKAAMDRANPTVMRWEREMAKFQDADPETDASGRWEPMECVFDLTSQPA
jgi:L-rhamnose mutarotase